MYRFENIQLMLDTDTAALLLHTPHCRYLTGLDYTDGGVLLTQDTAYLLTDSRYIEAAEELPHGMQCIACNGLFSTVNDLLHKHGATRLLTEQTLSLSAYQKLTDTLSVTVCADGSLDAALDAARLLKDESEIALLTRAQAITEAGFDHILPYIKAGVTERDIALELEFFMRKNGAHGVSFDLIVVSGENGSRPHGVPTDKHIQNGEFVTLDFGALYHGYHADMTRTVAVGYVTDKQKHIYDTVLAAQQAALSVLKAGITGKAADAAARDVITKAGFGAYFGHGTGHGVGVEIHEAPTLSPRAEEMPLPAGCVVTVEPGIYVPQQCGVRIEDMVLLTDDGIKNFTKAAKDLLIL